MKLYFSPVACSFSPHIALREAGLDFELVKVDLKNHTLVSDGSDFTKINPKGYVPVLELDNGTRLTEGPAIIHTLPISNRNRRLHHAPGRLSVISCKNGLASSIRRYTKVSGRFSIRKSRTITKRSFGKI